MTAIEKHVSEIIAQTEHASEAERILLQPKVDQLVTSLALQGHPVPCKLRHINNTLKDEALDEMFDNMPV